ncbi:hypothetical protein F9K94_15230 [Brucella tritici]|uniref:Uncharacterized protein n=1 Tax=Brucella tritici TaxID=94626 RepID=A0A7V7VSE7_9HYPH|nr:hypothetical protein [Brucella tritici]KAB2655877.1 hypothetical protein F9K94_15230 [Brucella tritici]
MLEKPLAHQWLQPTLDKVGIIRLTVTGRVIMIIDDSDYVYSTLCKTFEDDSVTVDVIVYKENEGSKWLLCLVEQDWGIMHCDTPFDTDKQALDFFDSAVSEFGIVALMDGEVF